MGYFTTVDGKLPTFYTPYPLPQRVAAIDFGAALERRYAHCRMFLAGYVPFSQPKTTQFGKVLAKALVWLDKLNRITREQRHEATPQSRVLGLFE